MELFHPLRFFPLFLSLGIAHAEERPKIDLWYGDTQRFGHIGESQPLVNILGSVESSEAVADAYFRLHGRTTPIVLGPDLHRLASDGDFNLEIERDRLKAGENVVSIHLRTRKGVEITREVTIGHMKGVTANLPLEIDFTTLDSLQDAVEVIDGKWTLSSAGARTTEPYYDRQLAFGDLSWTDYEVRAEVIFHEHFPPLEGRRPGGPPYLSHTHASFNLRWAGHPDDGFSPRRNWQNLGALVALRTDRAQPKRGSYGWLHFGLGIPGRQGSPPIMRQEEARPIPLESVVHYRMTVRSLPEQQSEYAMKFWLEGEPEPMDFQIAAIDRAERVLAGSVVFVAHHSDVTLRRVSVTALD